ncbi:DUF1996 domain-containing protein [Streptomyces sp. CdTB01]|uniref:DUF1996 domain-containing protein n=1 Tax=Streptomyces sp. CdTB01 TaxID=1725411 RepID=UPI00073A9CD5|nr:DUF1996 domain-containing protein [Streptomyces sp. CdTB01]ALV33141.1 hypothetical protein AS200_14630 [Streptomyces sp. CdTB01]
MANRRPRNRRRRMSRRHLALVTTLALIGGGGLFGLVTQGAFAHESGGQKATAAQQGTLYHARGGIRGSRNGGHGGKRGGRNNSGGRNNGGGQASASPSASATSSPVVGPLASDFVDITKVTPNVRNTARNQANASTGTFSSKCGVNAEGQHNPDNVIVAPGVADGAQHTHDYVGNVKVDNTSTNDSLAAQGTTCSNGDQSAYYWPVLRDQTKQGADAGAKGGGAEGNIGSILTPDAIQITFKGNPTSKVTAMPRFLRVITGDAKAFTNGPKNANASWSCTGFENKVQLKDKYPICPAGSKIVRSFALSSCWDGRNIDSADHRSHIVNADPNTGACPNGFKAVPQLTERLVFTPPNQNKFAVDSFPGQQHAPITDHADFINVMSDQLMQQAVNCINSGRRCG